MRDVWAKCEFTESRRLQFSSQPITQLRYEKEQAAAAAEKLAELGLGSAPSTKWRIQNSKIKVVTAKGYVLDEGCAFTPHDRESLRPLSTP